MKKKIRTECVIGNMPECPKCRHWNALLDSRDYKTGMVFFECRDCGFKVDAPDLIIVEKTLDAPGYGNYSTYTKQGEIPGHKWHLKRFHLTNEND